MRNKILKLSLVIFCGAASNSQVASAEATIAGFHSGGRFHTITIAKDFVAVRGSRPSRRSVGPMPFSDKALAKFDTVDVAVELHRAVQDESRIVGYPFWFSKEQSSVGVLTHEILVRSDGKQARQVIAKIDGAKRVVEVPFKKGLYLAKFSSPMKALRGANSLYGKTGIIYAHPNFIVPKDFRAMRPRGSEPIPTGEPLFPAQWHHKNSGQTGGTPGADIKTPAAWQTTTGDPNIRIAVIDGGFDLSHEDLLMGWYSNPGEIAGDRVDNDHNGYVDDVHGWNFEDETPDHSTGLFAYHGTATAGLVGARVNGLGVSGVCPNCTVLPITVSFDPARDAAAIYYAGAMGSDIISNSWGYPLGTPETDVVIEAINEVVAKGRGGKQTIVLFAMNNYDHNDCSGDRPDISSLPSVIAIGASLDTDRKPKDSGWGPCMELLAPTGVWQSELSGIVTTDMSGDQGYNPREKRADLKDRNYTRQPSGTSAATPIAAGVFGLVLSVDPKLTRNQALEIVIGAADKIAPEDAAYDPSSGFSQTYGYGRVNAARAVADALVRRKRMSLIETGSGF